MRVCACVHARAAANGARVQTVNNSVAGGDRGGRGFSSAFPVALGSTWASVPSVRVWLERGATAVADGGAVATLLRFNKGPLTACRVQLKV